MIQKILLVVYLAHNILFRQGAHNPLESPPAASPKMGTSWTSEGTTQKFLYIGEPMEVEDKEKQKLYASFGYLDVGFENFQGTYVASYFGPIFCSF